MSNIYILKSIITQIKKSIGSQSVETGGILGERNGVICKYYFDRTAMSHSNFYIPNIKKINKVISIWEKENIEFCGIIHSHKREFSTLSYNDKEYAKTILTLPSYKKTYIFFPIVLTSSDGEFDILPYVVKKSTLSVYYISLVIQE